MEPLLPGHEVSHHGLDGVNPRHKDSARGSNDHDGVGLRLGHGLDERVLVLQFNSILKITSKLS